MSAPPIIVQILLALIVVTAAMFDFRYRRVPNWLTLSGVLLGIGLNAFLFETPGLWASLRGLGLAFLIYFPLTAKGRFRKTLENIWLILMSVRTGRAPYENPQLDVRTNQGIRLPHAVVIAFGTFGFLIAAAIWAPQ